LCLVAVNRTIKIHVAGQPYVLRSDADEEYVRTLAEFVNTRIDALKGSRQVATQSDVVLAALKLADELQHERQLHSRIRGQARQQIQGMLDRLNLFLTIDDGREDREQQPAAERRPGTKVKVKETATAKERNSTTRKRAPLGRAQ
jgi:cell division protein ZapA (FtsZ GTPase activity inhibitor)